MTKFTIDKKEIQKLIDIHGQCYFACSIEDELSKLRYVIFGLLELLKKASESNE